MSGVVYQDARARLRCSVCLWVWVGGRFHAGLMAHDSWRRTDDARLVMRASRLETWDLGHMTHDPWLMMHDSCMPWDSWPEIWDLRHMSHDAWSWLIPWDPWFETWDLRPMRLETHETRDSWDERLMTASAGDGTKILLKRMWMIRHVYMHHKTHTSTCITRHTRVHASLAMRHTCTCNTCADDGTYLYTVTLCRLRHCNTLQHTSTHSYLAGCDSATHCNTLQHTATYCKYTLSRLGVFSRVDAQRHTYQGCHVRRYRSRLWCAT